jgi:hypothetical protein
VAQIVSVAGGKPADEVRHAWGVTRDTPEKTLVQGLRPGNFKNVIRNI